MLLSLLNRESITRFSVSWQKGHFIARFENGGSELEDRDGQSSTLNRQFSNPQSSFTHAMRIDRKFLAQRSHLVRDSTDCRIVADPM
jgi:hypothetical protein